MKVYVIRHDWSTDDIEDTEIYLFGTIARAYEQYRALIADEMDPACSHVKGLEWENGIPHGNCDFSESAETTMTDTAHWHVVDKWDWNNHAFIDLFPKEVL